MSAPVTPLRTVVPASVDLREHRCRACGALCGAEFAPVTPDTPWDREQAASFLRMSVSWTEKAARRGEVPSVRVGRRRFYRPAELRAYIEASRER